jgi:hypothetical protein
MREFMNNKIAILGGGLLAGIVAAFVVQGYDQLTEGWPLAGLLTMILALVTTGILYAVVYATTGSLGEAMEGMPTGLFAGAVGGILIWAIGGAIFGPFTAAGILASGAVGGLLFGSAVDPKA